MQIVEFIVIIRNGEKISNKMNEWRVKQYIILQKKMKVANDINDRWLQVNVPNKEEYWHSQIIHIFSFVLCYICYFTVVPKF